jgi:hypothetical protein
MTKHNLGNALKMLGQDEIGTTSFEEAVVVYRDALLERTRERVPLDWATTTGNQGMAMRLLAERRGDLTMAEHALAQITDAFETCREADHAPYASYII